MSEQRTPDPKPMHQDPTAYLTLIAGVMGYVESGSYIPALALLALWMFGHFALRINAQVLTHKYNAD